MRAIGYFRETDGAGGSLAEQSQAFLEFCQANGYEAAAAFLDAPSDGSDLAGYHQLVDFLRHQGQRGFLLVAVPGLPTLGDDLPKAARHYFQLISLGVQVVTMADGSDPAAELVEAWAREQRSKSLGERVRVAMRRRAVKGEVLGRPPYGYKVGPKRRLQIVPEEGAVVRYMGIRRIARRLNEGGLPTRRGGLWSMVTVRDILRNRAYVGTYNRFGVRVPASHPPLISPEDFRRVQERLDERRPSTTSRETAPFLLSGLVQCGYCGNKMIGVTRKQSWRRQSDNSLQRAQYRYYQCESRTNRSLCDYHTHREKELEADVRRILLGDGGRSKPALPVTGNEEAVLAEAETRCRRLRDKLRRLDRRLIQHMEGAAEGRLSLERLRALNLALAQEQLEVEEAMAEAQRALQQQATQTERRRQHQRAYARVRGEWERLEFAQRRELIRELVDRIIVRDEGIEALLRP
jgi:hypothetical protein